MASPKNQLVQLDVAKVDKVAAQNGTVEATLSVFFRGPSDLEGKVCLRFQFEDAKKFQGEMQGALIVARTQIR